FVTSYRFEWRGHDDHISALALRPLGVEADRGRLDIERHTALHAEADKRHLLFRICGEAVELEHRHTRREIRQNQDGPTALSADDSPRESADFIRQYIRSQDVI